MRNFPENKFIIVFLWQAFYFWPIMKKLKVKLLKFKIAWIARKIVVYLKLTLIFFIISKWPLGRKVCGKKLKNIWKNSRVLVFNKTQRTGSRSLLPKNWSACSMNKRDGHSLAHLGNRFWTSIQSIGKIRDPCSSGLEITTLQVCFFRHYLGWMLVSKSWSKNCLM